MSITGMRTGGACGFSSGVLRRGSISGSGSSKRGDLYESSEKKAWLDVDDVDADAVLREVR